jgi:pimeloyl-ACP methyl ester carboxylesterase
MSIGHMVEKMIVDHGIDRRRVFVTGLSAGGAMTSVMLATYPDAFAAGAIIAGLPYGTATNVNEAFGSMGQVRARSAREWGDLVRAASPHKGPWPRVSVWHGGADPVVKPENADEIIKQWTDVHGLDLAPTSTERVDGYPRQVWRNPAGQSVIESYAIPAMAHGTPLATGSSESTSKNNRYGHRDATLILVAYRHGLRASEICDLRWEQIDWNSATLHVRRVKSGKPSTHPIRGDELRSLRKLQREAPKSPFVFVSERGGPFTTDSFNWMVKRVARKAGSPFQVHAHMLRHSTGYKLAGDGYDTRSIQDYLGHKNIQHTVRYTELSPTRFKDFWRN